MNKGRLLVGADSAEPERLALYPVGITKEIYNAKDRHHKANYEDAQLSAIREGFHCGVVAWLLNTALLWRGMGVRNATALEIVDDYYAFAGHGTLAGMLTFQ